MLQLNTRVGSITIHDDNRTEMPDELKHMMDREAQKAKEQEEGNNADS